MRQRTLSGARAKHNGQIFEDLFFFMANKPGYAVTRMPDGCKRIGPKQLIQVPTACDWIVTKNGRTALIDTKSTMENSFPISKIKEHQVRSMIYHERCGAKAGYVIWLRPKDLVFFIPARVLAQLIRMTGSIDERHPDARILGKSTGFTLESIFTNDIGVTIGSA